MKKIVLSLLLLLIATAVFSQHPIGNDSLFLQTLGSSNTLVKSKGAIGSDSGFVNASYADTTAANRGKIKNYPGAIIRTGNTIWLRDNTATIWLEIGTGSSGGDTTLTWEDVLNNQGAIPFNFTHNTDGGGNNFTMSNFNQFNVNNDFSIQNGITSFLNSFDGTNFGAVTLYPNSASIGTGDVGHLNDEGIVVSHVDHDITFNADYLKVTKGLPGYTSGGAAYIVRNITTGRLEIGSSPGGAGIRDTAKLVQGYGIYINNADSTYQPNKPDVLIAVDTSKIATKTDITIITNSDTAIFIVDSISNAPPAGAVDGNDYLVGTSPTGLFAGHANDIAELVGGVYTFTDPVSQQQLIVDNSVTYATYQFNGTNWVQTSILWRVGGNRAIGTNAFIGRVDKAPYTMRAWNKPVLRLDTTRDVKFYKFVGTRPGNYAFFDSITGNIDTGFFRPLIAGPGISIDPGPIGDTISSTSGGTGGTLQDAYDASVIATDNPIIDANGGVFNIDNANIISLFSAPTVTSGFAIHDFLTRDAGFTRYSGFSSSYGVSSGDTSIRAGIVATNTLTQNGNIFEVFDTSAQLQQFWGTGTASDNTIQKFAHPPPITGQIYYIPVSVNGEVADAAGNITISGGGSGSDGNIWYREDSLLASDRTVGLNGKTLEFAGDASLFLNPIAGSETVTATTNDGIGNSNLYIRSNTDDGYGFDIDASNGTNAVSIVGDAPLNSITHTAATHNFIGTLTVPNGTPANGLTLTASANGGFVQSAELDNVNGFRMKYGNTDLGGGMRRNIGNNAGELRIFSDSSVNDARMTFYTKGSRAMLIDSTGAIFLDRIASASAANVLYYDASTKKVTYSTAPSGATPAGNYGNIQLNRNGVFTTPASDSLSFNSGVLNVKGNILAGDLSPTGTSTPVRISAGSTYGVNAEGSSENLKIIVYDNTNSASRAGIGFHSSGSLDIHGSAGGGQIIFTVDGGLEAMRANVSQHILIGTTTNIPSAKLVVTSTTEGFLPPRMTATQASAISSPAEGLMVYVTDTNGTFTAKGWWGYDGAAWQKLNN